MNALSHYLAPLQPGRGVLLWGGHLRALAAAAAAWGVARRAPVLVVDAANRFDPYGLIREAAGRGLSPQAALTRVHVARAFTSHQLVRLLTETFPAILAPGSLVLLLGPVSLFYDEQVPLGRTPPPLPGPGEPPGPDQDRLGPPAAATPPAPGRHQPALRPAPGPGDGLLCRDGKPRGPARRQPPGNSGGLGAPSGHLRGRAPSRRPLPTSERRTLTWTYPYPNTPACIPA